MRGCRQPFGFTIIEVFIVLAVSGFIFLSAVLLINGKQSSTEFTISSNDFKSELQHVVSDIIDGYYPNTLNYGCDPNISNPPTITNSVTKQGSATGCIFLGKVVQFNDTNLDIYVIAGNQYKSDGSPASSLSSADPILVAQGTQPPENTFPNVDPQIYSMEYGLMYACGASSIKYYNSVTAQSPCSNSRGTPIGAVAFATSSTSPSSSNGVQSGSLQINVIPIINTTINPSQAQGVSNIDTALANASSLPSNPGGGVKICLVGSASNYSALITIGSISRQPTVNLSIRNGLTC